MVQSQGVRLVKTQQAIIIAFHEMVLSTFRLSPAYCRILNKKENPQWTRPDTGEVVALGVGVAGMRGPPERLHAEAAGALPRGDHVRGAARLLETRLVDQRRERSGRRLA